MATLRLTPSSSRCGPQVTQLRVLSGSLLVNHSVPRTLAARSFEVTLAVCVYMPCSASTWASVTCLTCIHCCQPAARLQPLTLLLLLIAAVARLNRQMIDRVRCNTAEDFWLSQNCRGASKALLSVVLGQWSLISLAYLEAVVQPLAARHIGSAVFLFVGSANMVSLG